MQKPYNILLLMMMVVMTMAMATNKFLMLIHFTPSFVTVES